MLIQPAERCCGKPRRPRPDRAGKYLFGRLRYMPGRRLRPELVETDIELEEIVGHAQVLQAHDHIASQHFHQPVVTDARSYRVDLQRLGLCSDLMANENRVPVLQLRRRKPRVLALLDFAPCQFKSLAE